MAPSGEAFPAIDTAPAGNWDRLGINGVRSQDEEGVTVTHEQSVNEFRAGGSTGPMKAFRTEESLIIAGSLADLTLESYSYVLNGATIATVAPDADDPGTKTIGLSRGFNVVEFALLVRGISPYDETLSMQYEVPRVYESASAAPQFRKGEPALLAFEFRALEDLDATDDEERFGRLVAAHLPQTG